jgi:hypothetical protein
MGIFVTRIEMPQIAHIIEQYNTHVNYADKSDRMSNSYGIILANRQGSYSSISWISLCSMLPCFTSVVADK